LPTITGNIKRVNRRSRADPNPTAAVDVNPAVALPVSNNDIVAKRSRQASDTSTYNRVVVTSGDTTASVVTDVGVLSAFGVVVSGLTARGSVTATSGVGLERLKARGCVVAASGV